MDLVAALRGLHEALATAADEGRGQAIQLPIREIEIELQVGVTKTVEGHGGVKFWVLDATAGGAHAEQALQKLTVTLDRPVDAEGRPVNVERSTPYRP